MKPTKLLDYVLVGHLAGSEGEIAGLAKYLGQWPPLITYPNLAEMVGEVVSPGHIWSPSGQETSAGRATKGDLNASERRDK